MRKSVIILCLAAAAALLSCGKDFLMPEPLSFFAPENSLVDKNGLDALYLMCDKQLKNEWHGNYPYLVDEYGYTDLNVMAMAAAGEIRNMTIQVTPFTAAFSYWGLGWNGVRNANVGITRTLMADMLTPDERNESLAKGYFYRSYWYYRLVHQYGDVPLILEEVASPMLNLKTSTRMRILQKMKKDMEFAVQHLPVERIPGTINRPAGEILLTKIYLAVGEFDNAVQSATRCIEDYGLSLMTERFGAITDNPEKDVVSDLFHVDNISSSANKEGILIVQERLNMEGNSENGGSRRMRTYVPFWTSADVLAPNGKRGCIDGKNVPLIDSLGRGTGKIRPTNYYQYDIWKGCGSDMRHARSNWFDIKRLWYNNSAAGTWFRKPVQREFVKDTFRCYFSFPYYKVFVKDYVREGNNPDGGFTDQYIYRLPEAYLLRAEAYVWKNRPDLAAADIDIIRDRADAPSIGDIAAKVDINVILDERARELYLEEPRKCELTRIAFIMAQEKLNGYDLDNFHTKNFYYDRVMELNEYFAENYSYGVTQCIMEPYHVLWPIPDATIKANTQGVINQNKGYIGADKNAPPLDTPVD